MVAPVVGPLHEIVERPYQLLIRDVYKQSRPFDLVLPYRMDYYFGYERLVDSGSGYDSGDVKNIGFSFYGMPESSRYQSANYNRAYERLQSDISDKAGWLENIAQAGKARDMFNNRAVQLYRFTRAVSRKSFTEAARILRTPIPNGVSNKKALAQNFLEWEYGWKPIIRDLDSSMKILTSDPGVRRVKSVSVSFYEDNYASGTSGYVTVRIKQQARILHALRATVRVTNPNLFLANQLGLLDPALPWKLLPFSFVVDWLINVEQVISSMTDNFGLSLEKTSNTLFVRANLNQENRTWYDSPTGRHLDRLTRNQHHTGMIRETTIPGPTLVLKPFQGLSLNRGLQAIGLIVAVFGK